MSGDSISLYSGLWLFIFLMVATPGPANMLLMSQGAAYGFRANISFMTGLATGKLAINILIAFGFGSLLVAWPLLKTLLSFVAGGYLCVLALRSWHLGVKGAAMPAPLCFVAGLFVHPLSPKAWVMATLAYSQFIVGFEGVFARYALAPLSFLLVQIICHGLWCLAGAMMQQSLRQNPLLNRALIILTVGVVIWALMQ